MSTPKDTPVLYLNAKSEPISRITNKPYVGSLHSSSLAISAENVRSSPSDEETKWVPDHKHKHCMLCIKEFSMLNRKHHCRKCGALICGDCSQHEWRLNDKYERVCDSCFATLSNSNTPAIVHSYPHLQVLSEPNFFSWLRVFHKSWLRSRYPNKYKQYHQQLLQKRSPSRIPLVVVQTGLLYINIMEAHGLPDCDVFTEPDGYCIYYVTNNDPCFGQTTKYSTKVRYDTYEPEWNEDETIVITNTTGKLCIELWDYDFQGADDYLGKVEIKLNDLFLHFACKQPLHRIIDDWFEVQLAEPFKKERVSEKDTQTRTCTRKQSLSQKYTSTSGVLQISNANTDNLNITPVYKKLRSMPLLSLSNAMDEDAFAGKCYIHLQLKLHATFWGHFVSMFDPVLPPLPRREPFDMNRFYKELNTMLSYIYPVIDSSQSALHTLFWIKYMRASVYVLMFIYCVFNPWFALFWIQLKLLLFSCHSYLKQRDNIHADLPLILDYFCILVGYIPSLLEHIYSKHQELINKDDDTTNNAADTNTSSESTKAVAEEDITLGAFRRIIGNNIVRVSRLRGNLEWYQELLVWSNDTIEYAIDLFAWKYVSITMCIVTYLGPSCLLLVLCRNTALYQYEIVFAGTAIMTYFSKPVQFLKWFYSGTSRWYKEFYAPYKTFKQRMASSDPYDSDDSDDDDDEPQMQKECKTKERSQSYCNWMMDKIINVCYVCFGVLFGVIIIMKPLLHLDSSDKKRKEDDAVSCKRNPALIASKSEPIYAAQRTSKSSTVHHSESLYLSSKSISEATIAPANRKTMKKQPTLLRKKTLKQIENKADSKLDFMLNKLYEAKKRVHVVS